MDYYHHVDQGYDAQDKPESRARHSYSELKIVTRNISGFNAQTEARKSSVLLNQNDASLRYSETKSYSEKEPTYPKKDASDIIERPRKPVCTYQTISSGSHHKIPGSSSSKFKSDSKNSSANENPNLNLLNQIDYENS